MINGFLAEPAWIALRLSLKVACWATLLDLLFGVALGYLLKGKKPIWLLFDRNDSADIRRLGYKIGLTYSVPDFGITKLNFKFINPTTRKNELHEMILGEITGKE